MHPDTRDQLIETLADFTIRVAAGGGTPAEIMILPSIAKALLSLPQEANPEP